MITIGSGEHHEKLFLYVPTRSSEVVRVSVRAVQSQWPLIAIVSVNLHYSPIAITTCSQHRIAG